MKVSTMTGTPEDGNPVSSGYFNDPIMSSYRGFGFKDAITKPYRIEDLSEVLYKVIYGITDYHH
ncbi:MAG: hypothetical protein P8013_09020 [Candidatus Sulfobium sp.]